MNTCFRCEKKFKAKNIMRDRMCPRCLAKEPHISLKEKDEHNVWDHISDVFKVYKLMLQDKWLWCNNPECKYIDVRIDMRDGGCLITTRNSPDDKPIRISPEQLAWQYSKDTPERPKD